MIKDEYIKYTYNFDELLEQFEKMLKKQICLKVELGRIENFYDYYYDYKPYCIYYNERIYSVSSYHRHIEIVKRLTDKGYNIGHPLIFAEQLFSKYFKTKFEDIIITLINRDISVNIKTSSDVVNFK